MKTKSAFLSFLIKFTINFASVLSALAIIGSVSYVLFKLFEDKINLTIGVIGSADGPTTIYLKRKEH